ncbi:MAG: rhomboid family intramembrane serine protease [Planctomycetota bacterium]|nr:rhomboid family intramembrane serine protease [Planctomycetota bacterium]
MGIHDRDYARAPRGREPGPGVARRLTMLSATHWVIILCTAVFVVDALLGARGLLARVHVGDYYSASIDPRTVKPKHGRPPASAPPTLAAAVPIVDTSRNAVVGERRYQWMTPLKAVGHFSTGRGFFGLEVWRLITFQFLHADITHLAFNMLGLWFFGPLVEQHLRSRKRFWAYYLTCGICGAVLYLTLNTAGHVLNARVPGLLFSDIYTPLIGASAGVFGILMAAAFIAANEQMLVFFIPMKIRTGAYLLFGLAVLNLVRQGQNAGGDAAHVGGAVAGYFFIRNMHLLRDFFDVFGPADRSGRRARKAERGEAARTQKRVDAVLDKVSREGLHSLTEEEKEILRRATDEKRTRS